MKSQDQGGKDSFVEFTEDGRLVSKSNRSPAAGAGSTGNYKIIARDEITIKLDPGQQWRVAGGRFAVILAGDNLILEGRSSSERVILHRLPPEDDQELSEAAAREASRREGREAAREVREDGRHQEIMGLLRQRVPKQ